MQRLRYTPVAQCVDSCKEVIKYKPFLSVQSVVYTYGLGVGPDFSYLKINQFKMSAPALYSLYFYNPVARSFTTLFVSHVQPWFLSLFKAKIQCGNKSIYIYIYMYIYIFFFCVHIAEFNVQNAPLSLMWVKLENGNIKNRQHQQVILHPRDGESARRFIYIDIYRYIYYIIYMTL